MSKEKINLDDCFGEIVDMGKLEAIVASGIHPIEAYFSLYDREDLNRTAAGMAEFITIAWEFIRDKHPSRELRNWTKEYYKDEKVLQAAENIIATTVIMSLQLLDINEYFHNIEEDNK